MLCLFPGSEIILDIYIMVDHVLGIEKNKFMVLVLDHNAISLNEFKRVLHSINLAHYVFKLEEIHDFILADLNLISDRT